MLNFNTEKVLKFANDLECKNIEERETYIKNLSENEKIELIMDFYSFLDCLKTNRFGLFTDI